MNPRLHGLKGVYTFLSEQSNMRNFARLSWVQLQALGNRESSLSDEAQWTMVER
jgi:hypothetical protein